MLKDTISKENKVDNFYNLMHKTLKQEASEPSIAYTENGAAGYSTTKSALLDMSFKLSSYRNAEGDIYPDVLRAYKEDPELALKFLFFARDILQGAGERKFFRSAIRALAIEHKFPAHLVKYIPEYGRWDDVFVLRGTPLENEMLNVVRAQFVQDMENFINKKSFSLLAKWMPSVNTSSKDTCKIGYWLAAKLGISPRQYRKTLVAMRARLAVVEPQMCANKWGEIKYDAVPSKANALYKNAFLAHDYERRVAFLNDVVSGKKDIKAGTLFPHDIAAKYMSGSWNLSVGSVDVTLEELWKHLPNIDMPESTIVVADGSGSMTSRVGNTSVSALAIANALAIYFGERGKGEYANKYITFSERPRYVNFSRCKTLRDKLAVALQYNEIASTDIEAVFNLILNTAVNNNLRADELPANVLIISDMEFNSATTTHGKTLFGGIARKYAQYGYKLPKLIFWNVMSRTNVVPVNQNENGVVLVSGFSPNIMKMVMNGETDPYKTLVKTLKGERYSNITLKA